MKNTVVFLVFLAFIGCKKTTPPPSPIEPLPSEAQIEWQKMEVNMFIHFNMNTFTNMEWGMGSESPELFNPSSLDTRQWAKIASDAGMKGIIITAKHHDGFCLWPSEYTEHSVKNSPWKNGKGDVLKELSEACKEFGLKLGLYLSPWDRNHAEYGSPEYLEYYRNQMKEILSNYGDVFEFWVDGANGGTGYYGGANEERKIDRKTYYEWDSTFALAKSLQPDVIAFSDGGPGCRWIGNEAGWAGETNWSFLKADEFAPGVADIQALRTGQKDGDKWIPGEVDVSIRPGWYYHEYEDHKVKPISKLVDIYYESVGRNGLLLLNFPVDKRGMIHPIDSSRVLEMMNVIKNDFKKDLLVKAVIKASNVRGADTLYSPYNLINNSEDTYWTTDDLVNQASVEFTFKAPETFNRIMLQENIKLGQRIEEFNIEYLKGEEWVTLDSQTTIGYKRILRFEDVTTNAIRVNFTKSRACPVISKIGVYKAPKLLVEPEFKMNIDGVISLTSRDNLPIYYTIDGSEPSKSSKEYAQRIQSDGPFTLKAVSYNPENDAYSSIMERRVDIPKKNWSVVYVTSGDTSKMSAAIDQNPNTWWQTSKLEEGEKAEIIIDLGENYNISGLTYLPSQARFITGFISKYEIFISGDGENFGRAVKKGEFSNILNNPITQTVEFRPKRGRFIKFVAVEPIPQHHTAGFAEIGVITR